jgi:uncharacterized UPF0160 family protein
MKRLFLWISIVALVIIFTAAILALLSVFNLMPFFTVIPDTRQEKDQIVILVAMTDTLENQKFTVEKVWIIYYVLSRHDTMMVDQIDEQQIVAMELDQPIGQRSLIQSIEKDFQIEIDNFVLLDQQAAQSISNLYVPQENSDNHGAGPQVCEILVGIDGESLIKAFDLASNHIKTNLSYGLLMEIVDNKEGILCINME